MSTPDIDAVSDYLLALQEDICSQLAEEDGGADVGREGPDLHVVHQ